MIHTTEITVRGYHLDLYRHVNNARYLEFLEEARWQFMDDSGLTHEFDGSKLGLAVVNININYRRAAYMGEILRIVTSMKSIGARRCVMHQAITLKDSDTVIADADGVMVIVTRTSPSPNKVPSLNSKTSVEPIPVEPLWL